MKETDELMLLIEQADTGDIYRRGELNQLRTIIVNAEELEDEAHELLDEVRSRVQELLRRPDWAGKHEDLRSEDISLTK